MKRILVAAVTAALLWAPSAFAEESPVKALLEAKCGACHPSEKTFGAPMDRTILERTIKRMQAKKPGFISEEEAESIVGYLLTRPGN